MAFLWIFVYFGKIQLCHTVYQRKSIKENHPIQLLLPALPIHSNEDTLPSCRHMFYSNIGLCPVWNDGRHGRWWWGWWRVSRSLLLFLIFVCSDQTLSFFSVLFLIFFSTLVAVPSSPSYSSAWTWVIWCRWCRVCRCVCLLFFLLLFFTTSFTQVESSFYFLLTLWSFPFFPSI